MSQSIKNKVRQKEGQCEFCGVSNEQHIEEYDRQLNVHHIVPKRAGGSNRRTNLMVVCESCHKKIEHTQAEALQRIKEQLKEKQENEEKKRVNDEVEKLRAQRDGLLKRVHHLERLIRDGEFYKKIFGGRYVNIEVVTQMMGPQYTATTDHEQALEFYEESGNRIQRDHIEVDEVDIRRWVDKMSVQIDQYAKGERSVDDDRYL